MKIMQAINESMLHICDIMGAKLSSGNAINTQIYGSSIPIYKEKDGKSIEIQFFLYFQKEILKDAATTLLQSNYTEGDFDDLCRELANQIIGYAKNLLNEANIENFKLGTPEFLGIVKDFHINFNESNLYSVNDKILQIGYRTIE